ncbi:MAG TPA: pilin glycosylation ligase domain-containing protein, partial [Burkholderiaceae bacterium]|nr:pilin glycosylation ligase domain-containing protein [Burkholderiaceae bacterium]
MIRPSTPTSPFASWWPLLCALALPFVLSIHKQPLSTFYGEWWAAALWTGSFVYLLWTRSRAHTPAMPPVVLFPLALAAITAIQFLWIRPFQNDLAGLTPLVFVLGAAAILCGYFVRQRDHGGALHAATMIAWALLAASLLGVAAQVAQLFRAEFSFFGLVSEYFPTEQRRLWGNLNQPNHQATVHGLGLAALVFLTAARRVPVSLALIPALGVVFGIILTGSRTGVVHLGLATLLGLMLAGLSW